MRAKAGDTIVIQANHVGVPDRSGKILEVRGQAGEPPYVIQWSDDEVAQLFFPGPDAALEPKT